jgi:hypothetical protein
MGRWMGMGRRRSIRFDLCEEGILGGEGDGKTQKGDTQEIEE